MICKMDETYLLSYRHYRASLDTFLIPDFTQDNFCSIYLSLTPTHLIIFQPYCAKHTKAAVKDAHRNGKIKSRNFFRTLRRTAGKTGRGCRKNWTLLESAERPGNRFWPECKNR